jgi:hypothetical protein
MSGKMAISPRHALKFGFLKIGKPWRSAFSKNSENRKIDQSRKGKIVAPGSQAESSCLVFVRILVGDHPRDARFRIAT